VVLKFLFKVLEWPLLFLPPYKKWRARQIAKKLMRENTGESAVSQALGMDNKFRTSPVS
jgi:hypothetical protein